MANLNYVHRGLPQCLQYKIRIVIERDQDSLRPNPYDTYFLNIRDNNFIFSTLHNDCSWQRDVK
jgi:hypothetical protein